MKYIYIYIINDLSIGFYSGIYLTSSFRISGEDMMEALIADVSLQWGEEEKRMPPFLTDQGRANLTWRRGKQKRNLIHLYCQEY